MRRIEIQPKAVYWSETGELCCIATEESYFVLKFDSEVVANADKEKVGDDLLFMSESSPGIYIPAV